MAACGEVVPSPWDPSDPTRPHRQRVVLPVVGIRCRAGRVEDPSQAHPPYRPQTNGKVERYHRTMAAEWLYARAWTSNEQRRQALHAWLEHYNYHRPHSSLGSRPPISRATRPAVTNLAA
ncbi:MAG TPA: hypothetical protein DEB57_11350 [Microbacterium sp.]|nr:hypothetical protein [Microbacterium sp.]